MTKKNKYILILVLSFICFLIVFYQYKYQNKKHEILSLNGVKTNIVSTPYTAMSVNYVHYFFITNKGLKIEKNRKCGNECNKYVNETVIYNPSNPYEFELSNDFDNYDYSWRIIFFFCIYLPIMIFILFGIIQFLYNVNNKLKEN